MDEAMKGVDRRLGSKSGTPESRIKAARYEMKKVEGYWNDLQKKYPDTLGHPDVVAAKGRMDMYQRMKLYVEASNLFAEYQKTQFPEGKTDELLDLEKKLAYKLKTYNEELKMAADRYFEKAASEIKRGKSNLDKNEERTKDGKTKPILLHALVLNGIARDIAWTENLMPGDSRIPELKKEFEALQKEQGRWREKMIESTVMIPHKFNGKESSALKEMSENIVKNKFSDAKILRVNVISSDWKEERALEYTDTTKTAIRLFFRDWSNSFL
jgi:hypothetical protein